MKLTAAPQAGSPLCSDKLRRMGAKLRRSQPVFALKSFDAVRLAVHPCSKLQGILAKTKNINRARLSLYRYQVSKCDQFYVRTDLKV